MLPNALSRPPMTAVGSRPARSSISATIDVVVVLPCAPAIAMPNRSRISSASISARGITGTCRARASTTSGLSAAIADETTTTSASPTFAASWPMPTRTPSVASRSVTSDRRASDPLTRVAEIRQQFGDAAHADAADPDEVHAPRASEPRHQRRLPFAAARPARARDRRCARPRPAARTVASPRPSRASRCAIGEQVAGDRRPAARPVRSRSSISTAAPALDEHLGVLALVIVGRRRKRHEHRRPARRRQLRQRRRARPADHQIGRGHFAGDRVQEGSARARDPGAPVAFADGGQVPLAGLVDDVETGMRAAPAPAPPPPWPR